ncbi:MAG: polyhydroxyalkanoate depolymerase [Holosporaceae bacterium]|nr:polyhydroxyalkanoate depolymerase [Holosporaceae bacterium]
MYRTYDYMSYISHPLRKLSHAVRSFLQKKPHALDFSSGKLLDGFAEMYERQTRYGVKPEFNINSIEISVKKSKSKNNKNQSAIGSDEEKVIVNVYQTTVLRKDFCDLVHFAKENQNPTDPKVLIIAPISGHFATLLRDTVQRMIPKHDVYITDWKSMRNVPLAAGSFNLDNYLSYLIDFLHYIGPHVHVMAVCQPSVQVIALAAIMEDANDPCRPASIIPMGGPIDPRANPTDVNRLAESHSLSWFERKFLTIVPDGHPGSGRRVYPGFIQLTAFINMNPGFHYRAHTKFLEDKILDNSTGVDKHATFYDEYLSVLDMDDIYYLETIEKIFQTYELPRGIMKYKGNVVDLRAIKRCALMTIEGEKDDISAPGQTFAVHKMCANIPEEMREHYLQRGVGHYGVFSGSKWRSMVAPKIEEFIGKFDPMVGIHNSL